MLKIDEEFKELIPSLSEDELDKLQASLDKHGCMDEIKVWKDIVVDGHNRYAHCLQNDISYTTQSLKFDSRDEAKIWIIDNQLGRRNLSSFSRCELRIIREALLPGRPARRPTAEELSSQISANLTPTDRRKESATLAGVSHDTYAKAKVIHKEATDEQKDMLRSQETSINAVYMDLARHSKRSTELRRIREVERADTPELSGEYDVIVCDPPWPMEKISRDVRPNQVTMDYPTMSVEEIEGLEIPKSKNCHMFLWTTQKYLPASFDILKAWDFRYVCCFVWHKPGGFQPVGLPQYNCEFVLYARHGTPIFTSTKEFNLCFNAKRGKHSEKPEEFYELLRGTTGGRRLDMFNRRKIEGFSGWGKES